VGSGTQLHADKNHEYKSKEPQRPGGEQVGDGKRVAVFTHLVQKSRGRDSQELCRAISGKVLLQAEKSLE